MENEIQKPEDKIAKFQAWENVIKSEITSLAGLVMFGAVIWDFLSESFNIPVIPIPGLDAIYVKYAQMAGETVISIVLFRAPDDFFKKCLSLFSGFKPKE